MTSESKEICNPTSERLILQFKSELLTSFNHQIIISVSNALYLFIIKGSNGLPITVSCNFPSGKTILGETEEIEVSQCPTILCFEHEFETDFPQSQINALMDASMTCSQELTYTCISAPWKVWDCLDIRTA